MLVTVNSNVRGSLSVRQIPDANEIIERPQPLVPPLSPYTPTLSLTHTKHAPFSSSLYAYIHAYFLTNFKTTYSIYNLITLLYSLQLNFKTIANYVVFNLKIQKNSKISHDYIGIKYMFQALNLMFHLSCARRECFN